MFLSFWFGSAMFLITDTTKTLFTCVGFFFFFFVAGLQAFRIIEVKRKLKYGERLMRETVEN